MFRTTAVPVFVSHGHLHGGEERGSKRHSHARVLQLLGADGGILVSFEREVPMAWAGTALHGDGSFIRRCVYLTPYPILTCPED